MELDPVTKELLESKNELKEDVVILPVGAAVVGVYLIIKWVVKKIKEFVETRRVVKAHCFKKYKTKDVPYDMCVVSATVQARKNIIRALESALPKCSKTDSPKRCKMYLSDSITSMKNHLKSEEAELKELHMKWKSKK